MRMHGLSQSTRELVTRAFEAGAGMLRTLEAISASLGGAGEQQEAKEHVDRAIGLLRRALDELRGEDDEESHPGALGFTIAVRRRRRRTGDGSESGGQRRGQS